MPKTGSLGMEINMHIGAMNHPQRNVLEEIKAFAEMGLEFIDLTLEPPAAAAWQIDEKTIRQALKDYSLGIVGHTAYYLPLGSPFEEVRRGALKELIRCMNWFAAAGAKVMNIHPDSNAPMHDRKFIINQNLHSLRELLLTSKELGMTLMIENLPGHFNTVHQLAELLEPLPDLALHLDIGHTNLIVHENTTEAILEAYGKRLRHVHLHDNKGGSADLHLPLGAGTLDTPRCIRALKKAGYDGTITLEVFTPDPSLLRHSSEKLRALWGGSSGS